MCTQPAGLGNGRFRLRIDSPEKRSPNTGSRWCEERIYGSGLSEDPGGLWLGGARGPCPPEVAQGACMCSVGLMGWMGFVCVWPQDTLPSPGTGRHTRPRPVGRVGAVPHGTHPWRRVNGVLEPGFLLFLAVERAPCPGTRSLALTELTAGATLVLTAHSVLLIKLTRFLHVPRPHALPPAESLSSVRAAWRGRGVRPFPHLYFS